MLLNEKSTVDWGESRGMMEWELSTRHVSENRLSQAKVHIGSTQWDLQNCEFSHQRWMMDSLNLTQNMKFSQSAELVRLNWLRHPLDTSAKKVWKNVMIEGESVENFPDSHYIAFLTSKLSRWKDLRYNV